MSVTLTCDKHGGRPVKLCRVDLDGRVTLPASVALTGVPTPGKLRRATKAAAVVESVWIAADGRITPSHEVDHYAYRTGDTPRERQRFTCLLCGDSLSVRRERWPMIFDHLDPENHNDVTLDRIRATLGGNN